MNLYDFKKSFYSGVIFFSTVIMLSIGYGLVGNLSVADKVGSGSGLTATSWNRIVDGVLDLDARLSNLTFSGGNVGIGGGSPGAKFYINSDNLNDATTKAQLQQYSALTIKPHNTNSTNMNIWQVNNGTTIGIQVTNYNATANWNIALNPFGGNVGIGTPGPSQRLDLGGGTIGDGNIGGSIKIGGEGIGSSGSCILSAYSNQASCPAGWTRLAPGLCTKCQ